MRFGFFNPRTKQEARTAERYWDGVKRHGLYASGILGGLTTSGRLSGSIPAVASLAAAWFADTLAAAAKHLADDPARSDYKSTTQPRPRPFYEEALGASDLERVTVQLGRAALEAAADVEAVVRACERAMGAHNVDSDSERKQLAVATELAQEASRGLERVAAHCRDFAFSIETADEVTRADSDERAWIYAPPKPLSDVLPTETLASLYRVGVPIRFLHTTAPSLRVRRPGQSLADSLREASGATLVFATALREWRPVWQPRSGPEGF
jgi:hypothetical protein